MQRGHGVMEGVAPREVHLRDYWKVIWQGRYTVLTVLVTVLALTILKVELSTPIYKASLELEIRPEARRILPGQEQLMGAEGGGWLSEEKYFNTQLEVLRSRDLAERVYRKLHLETHRDFKGLSDPVGAFAGRVEVKPKVNTRLVTVSLETKDPKEAREWVNALGDCYVKRNVDQATASFTAILGEIERGMETFRSSLGQADAERLRTMASKDLFVPENVQEVIKQNLQTYNEGLTQQRVRIGSLSTELQAVEQLRSEGGDTQNVPRFVDDPVMQDLRLQKQAAERELARLAEEKRPTHPDYVAKVSEVRRIDDRIKDQVGRVGDKLRTELRLARENATYLENQIRTTEKQAYTLKQASSTYDLAKTESDSRRKVYDVVTETMQRLTVAAQLISMNNNVSILDRAVEPRRPVRPRRVMSLALGGLIGLLMGVGTVLLLDYFDNTIRTPEDVEQYLGLSILGIVPRFRESESTVAREAYQSLRTSILFSSHNREKKILLFTSAGPQEGKSNTVAQVSRALASAGDRVVVLDCDLRRPTQHHHMKVTREPGLTNYLLEGRHGDYAAYMHDTDLPTLKLFTCGPIPPNPPELLGLPKFRNLLADLRGEFDWVVIDSPPVASLADSIVLASMAEMMAVVIKHNQNDRELIRRSLKRLSDVKVHVIGAVLNHIEMGRGNDYYYAGYYYYGSDEGEREGRRVKKFRSASNRPDSGTKVAL